MRVMGIDPGIAMIGYGILERGSGQGRCIAYGCIKTESNWTKAERLAKIYHEVAGIIKRYTPEQVALEELFFNKNAKTALTVGEARGTIIVSAFNAGLNVYEYTPLQVKQAVAGYGRASKDQIQKVLAMILGLKDIPKPVDAADALAVAFCHLHWSKWREITGRRKV
ncbi:MAG: crossover junction endodeoxyribonuclease RuvC [Dethiobacteria bacterium]|jgi:crossover junction endodeoxyribonuclease RuvC|nr:crossover junction endodeoxyribonuclease RuvC [Bacillota bacterium]